MSDPEYPADQPLDTRDLPLLLGAGLGLYLALSAIGPGLDGPSYLVAFTVMWVFLMFVHTAARRVWRDSFAVSVVAAAVLMGVAFARYRWGVERGMQRWGLLIAMTILGCAVFFVRVSQPRPGAAGDRADDRFSRTGCGTATGGCGSDTAGGCGASTGGGGCGGGSGGMRRMRGWRMRGLIGLGYRAGMSRWLSAGAPDVECLELTAEHFFDASDAAISTLGERYPCSVHGLGLSLGTPGPLDEATLSRYSRVARLARARWATEHVAFTHAAGIDLGHLNPVAPTASNLALLVEHAFAVHEATGLPVCLENIAADLRLTGTLTEPDFLNALCESPHIRLLLDVTNLFVNAHNHGFDPHAWIAELQPGIVRQIHVVGFGTKGGRMVDDHRAPIQCEILDLMAAAADRHDVDAVILERDLDIPGPEGLIGELLRVRRSLGWN